jgi:hypothetical protein
MLSPEKKALRSGLIGAVLLALAGLLFLLRSRYAQLHHIVIPGSAKSGWMTPGQGYFVASLFFALAAYSIILGFRNSRRGK